MVSDHRPAVTRRLRLQGRAVSRHAGNRARPRQEWIEIAVPAIIDEETFAAAARQLEDNKRFAARNTKLPSLLQGLISCQRCGYAYYRSPTQTTARKLYYYRCIGSDGWRYEHGPVCRARPVRADEVEAIVWEQVTALLADPSLIEAELERRLAELRQSDPTKAQRNRLQLEMSKAQAAASRLVSAYQEDLVPLDELRARMPELRKRQASIRAQLDALDSQLVDRETFLALAENLESFLARLRDAAENASIQDRQRIVRLLVRDVLIGPDQVVIRHSIPTSKQTDPPPGYVLRRRGDCRALRATTVSRYQAPILPLHWGFQPPLHVKRNPDQVRVLPYRSHDELVVQGVEEGFDVQVYDPVRLPAPFPAGCHCVQRRAARSISIRVGVKDRFHLRL